MAYIPGQFGDTQAKRTMPVMQSQAKQATGGGGTLDSPLTVWNGTEWVPVAVDAGA